MPTGKIERIDIRTSEDVVRVRQQTRLLAVEAGLSLVDQTKIITAASELARNTLDYGGGGELRIEIVENGVRRGVRLTFEDQGPGIADIQQALKDGFTSGSGLGLGLGGARRLSNEFNIEFDRRKRHKNSDRTLEDLMIAVPIDDASAVADARRAAVRWRSRMVSATSMPAVSRWWRPNSAPTSSSTAAAGRCCSAPMTMTAARAWKF